ncbi:hypothetical protein M3196_00180 [Fictibacillus nanhaiensis]|uniref:hypothetical protein n=1 Tax=Fictibacillus nanhaiensis TaxID=742169 RepID=UPI00203C8AB6|nr:hypothetical protein [Fictibacillus nanhaiensis]MCM3730086.1 hypothetical protein [Fictibacillus nanhaiensis]
MKKWLGTLVLILTLLLIPACSSEGDTSSDNQEEIKPVVKDEADSTEDVKEEEKEKTETSVPPVKAEITKDEFNQKFKFEVEEEQYENGKFELADGSTINADYFSYGENELFVYALAIFHEGKLSDIQFETEKSQEEVAEALGISFENATVEENNYGFEVNFDETFNESNISVYPNEWD